MTVRLEDRVDVPLLLDTGAGTTSLPSDVVAELALPSGDALARRRAAEQAAAVREELLRQVAAGVTWDVEITPGDAGRSIGIHGVAVRRPQHQLHRLELGGEVWTDVLVDADAEGRLGRDVLARRPFLVHGPRRELWLLQRTAR